MELKLTITEENKKEILNKLLYYFLEKNDLKNNVLFYKDSEDGKKIIGDLQFMLEFSNFNLDTFKLTVLYLSDSIDKIIGFHTFGKINGDLKKDLEKVLTEIIDEFFKYLEYVTTNNESNYIKKEGYFYIEHFKVVSDL